jgi:hypothetical protein
MKNSSIKKSFILSSLLIVLVVTGCRQYLEQTPITEFGTDFVFNSKDNAYKALIAVYSRLMGDQGYGIRLSLYYTVDNDETQGPTGAGDNDRRDIARYAATSGNNQLSSPFNQLFTGIEYANICISNIPKMSQYAGNSLEAKQLQRMYGEALTLRAQFYFEAIRNWGDLPANFQPAAELALTNPFPVRVNRDSLYDKLIADLKVAADLVPWRNELSSIGDAIDERITKGTVKGLRARLALFRGGFSLRNTSSVMERSADYAKYYQIARDECNDIINSGQHSLNADYKSLWKNQVSARVSADPNGELMFQASAIGANGTDDSKLAYYNGPTVNGFGNKSINILPTYFYTFDSTDLRRDVTCCLYNVNADGSTKTGQAVTAIVDGKYRRDWISNPVVSPTNAVQYFSLKWQILRYSDVLLMFAEAENEINNGPTAAAYNAINQVRRRGFGKSLTAVSAVDIPAGLSKSQFFTAIVNERSFELGGEGVRKYDLIRWNLLTQKINDSKTAMAAMAAGSAPYAGLPTSMYFKTNSTSDDNTINGGAWVNSFYKTAPSATPTGTTKITWIGSTITAVGTSSPLGRFATGFTPNKSELLPIPQAARDANANLTQNPGY